MAQLDLKSSDTIKSLYEKSFLPILASGEDYVGWLDRYTALIEKIDNATTADLTSQEYQRLLWNENPISSVGADAISTKDLISSQELAKWISELPRRRRELPQESKARARALREICTELSESAKEYTKRVPWLRILRLMAAIFLEDMTCVTSRDCLEKLAKSMFAEIPKEENNPIGYNLLIMHRLKEILGSPGPGMKEIAQRAIFAWHLYKVARGEIVPSGKGKKVIKDKVSVEDADKVSVEDAVAELFMEQSEFEDILELLNTRKNVIIQGSPGTGKTFMSKRLAYALIGRKDPDKVCMIQFHQSYSYEDFIQGYRPAEEGGFKLKDGPFYRFCRKAAEDAEMKYVFIIDEINRGNLSKIFGELMMLIEADKRGSEFAIPLTYSESDTSPFHVPKNVYLLGMMNTADRSLAMVDYALRRRFAFVEALPQFGSRKFNEFMSPIVNPKKLLDFIITRMNELNEQIAGDTSNLGPGYCIGHSFFCPNGGHAPLDQAWYDRVIRTEIAPLLREYWFDNPARADQAIAHLSALD